MRQTVLRGATVVDGTGAVPRPADVVIDGPRITAIEAHVQADGADVIDLSGLTLAPGFIDIHTHLDAQILWDPDVTPSSWHGVTTVLMGNCGLGVAPTRPDDRDDVLAMLVNVEGMSPAALNAGVAWSFETFPEYLQHLDAMAKRVNVGSLVGHSVVRQYVMGADAHTRAATPEEIEQMRAVVRDALDAGAFGVSSSRAQGHVGQGGRPIPSRVAGYEELLALVGELAGRNSGMVEIATGKGAYLDEFVELSNVSGRPVTWGALLTGFDYAALAEGKLRIATDGTTALDVLEQGASLGGHVLPQISCRELTFQFHLLEPFTFASLPSFDQVLRAPADQKAALYADSSWRQRARAELDDHFGQWYSKTVIAESDAHPELVGRSVVDVARERECQPFDVIADVSLDDGLQARFTVVRANDDVEQLALLLRDPRTLLGLSDAGAHADQLCDAAFSTHLLGTWVRERRALTLEMAVWRLSGHPASVLGLADRGRIAPGCAADLVAFDPNTIGTGPNRRVADLPTGADRLVADARGIEHVWVNGVRTIERGTPVPDAYPGAVLRAPRGAT